jgi:hypothetical protein
VSKFKSLVSHFEEYVARYAVLAVAILTPAVGLLGSLAANAGGVETSSGRALLAVGSAIGFALTAATFLKNLGSYQIVRDFDAALEIDEPDAEASVTPESPLPEHPTGMDPSTIRPVD